MSGLPRTPRGAFKRIGPVVVGVTESVTLGGTLVGRAAALRVGKFNVEIRWGE